MRYVSSAVLLVFFAAGCSSNSVQSPARSTGVVTSPTLIGDVPGEGVVIRRNWTRVPTPLLIVGLDGQVLGRISPAFDIDPESQLLPGEVILRGHGRRFMLDPKTDRFVAFRRVSGTSGGSVRLSRDCREETHRGQRRYLVCGMTLRRTQAHPATIDVLARGRIRKIVGSPSNAYRRRFSDGLWQSVALSPDGKTLLALWSADCEEPTSFFVDVATGRMRAVTGERDWRKAPESIPLGWSHSGQAVVNLLSGGCGDGTKPAGIYLIEPKTLQRRLVHWADGWAVMWHR